MSHRVSRFVRFVLVICLATAFSPSASAFQSSIPTPESEYGFEIGADFKLVNYEQSIAYFNKLDAASDAMSIEHVGQTSEGRDWYFAVISSPENLANLDRLKEIAQLLAHPAGLSDAEARSLAREGKMFVSIDGGLHATEVAGAQQMIQLAYNLVDGYATGDAEITSILDEVVVLLWPSLNPDGQTMITDWYMDNVGTPYEVSSMPQLYQKYIGHDNNRDAYMVNMIESRVVERTWREWEPQVTYTHHQSSPPPTRIWMAPYADPVAPYAPPLMMRELNAFGMAIAQKLDSEGKPGATHMGKGWDAWYPGYIDFLGVFQNVASFITETALYSWATPNFYTNRDYNENCNLCSSTLYASKWKGGWWRLRDAVDYMLTASMAVLEYSSKYSETLQYNRYQAGRTTINRYESEPPFAYFIPQKQRDPVAPVEMLRRLAFNGIRISQLTTAVTVEGVAYPAGTWVIPMNQEFAELARQLLSVQEYPDLRDYEDGPPEQPYDAAGWTLQFQFGVHIAAAEQPLQQELLDAMVPVEGMAVAWDGEGGATFDSPPGVGFDTNPVAAGIIPPAGKITGSGSSLLVDPAQNNSFRLVNRALDAGGSVSFRNDADGRGRYSIEGVSSSTLSEWVDELAIQAVRSGNGDDQEIRTRIGLYRPWNASMDEGWTRWLLEAYEFEFSNITPGEMQAGNLGDRYDVILLPSISSGGMVEGFRDGSVPPQFEAGMGQTGLRYLDQFVKAGGTLVCLNLSCQLAIDELHLPVKNVVADLEKKDYFVGISILEVSVDTSHPVMAGMSSVADITFNRSPVFTTLDGFEGTALASYQKKGSPLRSGYLLGEKYLQGYAAALDAHHGDGHVIMFGFSPQWRAQPFGTFRALFNSLYFAGELAQADHGDPDFWNAPEEKKETSDDEEEEEDENGDDDDSR